MSFIKTELSAIIARNVSTEAAAVCVPKVTPFGTYFNFPNFTLEGNSDNTIARVDKTVREWFHEHSTKSLYFLNQGITKIDMFVQWTGDGDDTGYFCIELTN